MIELLLLHNEVSTPCLLLSADVSQVLNALWLFVLYYRLKPFCKLNLIWSFLSVQNKGLFSSAGALIFLSCLWKLGWMYSVRCLKRLCSSDLGELDKSLCSVKNTTKGLWKSLSTQYIPFQSTRCSSLCLTLIKHNHQAIRESVWVESTHWNTHTHTKSISPSILPVQVELTTPGSWRLN